jgi:hypothetical protein
VIYKDANVTVTAFADFDTLNWPHSIL